MKEQKASSPSPRGGAAALGDSGTSRAVIWWLKGLTFLVLGSWALLGLHMLPRNNADTEGPAGAPDSPAGSSAARSAHSAAGRAPWGRLSYMPITISPPLELVPMATPLSSGETQWHFSNMIAARLPALLAEIGLSDSLREKLVSLAEPNPAIEGLTIRPPRELVLGLSSGDRTALYTTLAGIHENLDQRNAFRFCGGSLGRWIDDSPLSPEARDLIEPLVYRHGSFLFFADMRSIEESLPSAEARSQLVKALSHESTFLAHLEISAESDLAELVEYWGRGGRTRDVRPLLESLYEAEGERSIDVTYLLPPFARRRIYTYDVLSEENSRYHRDCHWTALNFFAEQPDDRFGESQEVARALREDYFLIYGNLGLGDLVAFFNDQMSLIHTAVFIADDVLFTKNGRGSEMPWMLIRLEDMKGYYPRRNGLQVRYYRRKDLS